MKKYPHILSQMYTMMNNMPSGTGIENIHSTTWQPAVDIYERDEGIVIVVELPGLSEEQIDVTVEGGVLKIKGHRPKRIPDNTRHVHQMEIPYGHFARFVSLPSAASIDDIEANFEGGYLTVTIPGEPADE
jgi:HSP20 family protein